MSRYLNTAYGGDTYGIRVRTEIPFNATCIDYGVIRLDVGAISGEYTKGTRVVVCRSHAYWPRPPKALGPIEEFDFPEDFVMPVGFPAGPGTDISMLPSTGAFDGGFGSGFQAGWDDTVLYAANIGFSEIPSTLYDTVDENAVAYYRIYVAEPLKIGDPVPAIFQEHIDALHVSGGGPVPDITPIDSIWSPWEVRGQAFVVGVGDHGGVRTTIDAFPNGLLTGGDVYGIPDEESTQYQFLSSMGFLADIVATDGTLMIDRPEFSHPNMVRPLLKAFGLSEDEDNAINAQFATWNREFESPYLKRLAFAYRDLSLRKGTSDSLSDYAWLAYGTKNMKVSEPENLVLTVTDSSPREFFNTATAVKVVTVGALGHGRTSADLGALYSIGGNSWYLDTIVSSSQVKLVAYNHSTTLPTSGTLTWVSGGTLTTSFGYTTASSAVIPYTYSASTYHPVGDYYSISAPGQILSNGTVTVTGANWTRQPVWNADLSPSGYWSDVMTNTWAVGPQDSLVPGDCSPGHTGYIDPVIADPILTPTDTWSIDLEESQFYDQFTDFVYQLSVPKTTTVTLGSAGLSVQELDISGGSPVLHTVTKPDFQRCIVVQQNVPKYSIRCRVKRQTGHITNGNFITDWLDANGNQIFRTRIPMDSAQLALVNGDTGWHELSNIGPGGTTNGKPLPYAKYMSWSVELIGDATVDSVVCVGAVHISATDLATYPVYRNPRSVVLLVDWTDISVTIDQRIALAKLRTSARDWIPANVDFRILTSEAGAEYLALTTPPGVGDPDGPVLYNDGRVEYGGDWELLGVPQLENNVEYNQHDFPGSS